MTDLAKLHTDVVFGRSGGRIIWQPRIQCWYDDKKFSGEGIPEPYSQMSVPDLYRALGCSARLYRWFNPCFRRVEPRQARRIVEQLNETDTKVTIETPVGKQVWVDQRTPDSPAMKHLKWPVETEQELKVATWIEENATWQWDQETFDRALDEVGDLGAPTIYLPRMNVQDLYLNQMGVEKAVYAIYDWTDTVEAYFRALEQSQNRLIDIVCNSPIEIVNMGENVHSGTLPPNLFLKYHLPACQRRCARLHSAGKFASAHWDGDCGPLLQFACQTGLDGIEAITPVPQGDVTLEQIKEAIGNELFLLDGIPAIYFDKTFSVDVLLECTKNLIDLFAPKLVLGISDEISSTGDIERIRLVGDIVDEYNTQFDKEPNKGIQQTLMGI